MWRISERGNTWTHFVGVVFALSCIWMVWPAVGKGWQMTMGVIFFIVGMFLMFLSSTIYHWVPDGVAKRVLRKLDHISIYVMIACSYTPICIGVIGGWVGWTLFGVLWAIALGGTFYKIFFIGRYPALSLGLYLAMGWVGMLILPEMLRKLPTSAFVCVMSEAVLYTVGTYFFYHDSKHNYHTIWHIFVLLGAMAHCTAVILVIYLK